MQNASGGRRLGDNDRHRRRPDAREVRVSPAGTPTCRTLHDGTCATLNPAEAPVANGRLERPADVTRRSPAHSRHTDQSSQIAPTGGGEFGGNVCREHSRFPGQVDLPRAAYARGFARCSQPGRIAWPPTSSADGAWAWPRGPAAPSSLPLWLHPFGVWMGARLRHRAARLRSRSTGMTNLLRTMVKRAAALCYSWIGQGRRRVGLARCSSRQTCAPVLPPSPPPAGKLASFGFRAVRVSCLRGRHGLRTASLAVITHWDRHRLVTARLAADDGRALTALLASPSTCAAR